MSVLSGIVWVLAAAALGLLGLAGYFGGETDVGWGVLYGLLGLIGLFMGFWQITRRDRTTTISSLVLAVVYLLIAAALYARPDLADPNLWYIAGAGGLLAGIFSAIDLVTRRQEAPAIR
jgi:peptidoglycan/LPS O-acetylase OafA/YrhL